MSEMEMEDDTPRDVPRDVPAPITPARPSDARLTASDGFAAWLAEVDASLALTTYQTRRLVLVGRTGDGSSGGDALATATARFDRPMGLWADPHARRLVLATRHGLVTLADACPLTGAAPGEAGGGPDRRFVPRRLAVTGALDAHDVHEDADGRAVFVNTTYSCLAVPDAVHSFRPVWTPPFISALRPEDRCHLNGLAMRAGRPAFVTAVSRSDTAGGWRARRADGGVVLDVATGAAVATGLSMPHAPRLHDGALYLLNAGTGELGRVDAATGRFEPVAFVPGFARGLAFVGGWAVVGLSRPRRHRAFRGLPLDARLPEAEARCGLAVIDLATGRTAHTLTFTSVVEELYDVQVLPGVRRPVAQGLASEAAARVVTFVETPGAPPVRHTLAPPADRTRAARPASPTNVEAGDAGVRDVEAGDADAGDADDALAGYVVRPGRQQAGAVAARFGALAPPALHRRLATGRLPADARLWVLVAEQAGAPVALACARRRPRGVARLEALAVAPAHRRRGVATALVARLERMLAAQGLRVLEARYRDDAPGAAALARLAARRGWDAPRLVRRRWTTPATALADALPPPAEALPDGAALVPWAALTMADRQHLLRREDAGGPLGHPAAAAPFRHDARADLAHSLAVRHTPPTHTPTTPDAPAPVVAWLLLHPVPDAADARGAPGAHDDRPAWTAAPLFVAPGHRRRGLATALAATAARRLAATPHAAPHATLHWHAAPDADAAHAFATARLAGAATHTAGDYLAATRLR